MIGATVASAVSAASRCAGEPASAAYVVSAATIEESPDGLALSVGSAGRATSGSASSAVSKNPPLPFPNRSIAVSSSSPASSSQRPSPVSWCTAQNASARQP